MPRLTRSARWLLGGRGMAANQMELAVERLGSALRLGAFPVGTRLPPERELASIVGVSRSTLREALRLLTEQGTLEVQRGRGGGTFVVHEPERPALSEVRTRLAAQGTTLAETLDQRWAIETAVAELAARRATPAQVAQMHELLSAMEAAHGETAAYRRLDTDFHLLLGESARSARLGELLAQSHRELADLMAAVPHSVEIRRHSSGQHRRLVTAIERGRPDAARRVMDEHVMATAAFLVGLVGDGGQPAPRRQPVPAAHDPYRGWQ